MLANFLKTGFYEQIKFRQDYDELIAFSRDLNEQLQAEKIKEAHRGLLICGILVALGNEAFKQSYKVQWNAKQLAENLVISIINEFTNAQLPPDRIVSLRGAFSFIELNTTLTTDKDFFVSLIEQIDTKVNSFIKTHKYHDALGQFYVQFLRYANNDKGLGIVLTPPHIAELFAELAGVNKSSVVYDNCCGTGGLLIAAMKRMLGDGTLDDEAENEIKENQLIGLEFQDDIYALARIHRRTSLGTALEEASGCSSESGIMVLEQKPARKQGAPNRCCHRTNPTVSASSLTTIAWWPMPACSCRPP